MQQKNFKVSFIGSEYNAWYVTELDTAKTILSELQEKDCLFGIDTETAPLPEWKSYSEAGLSPHLSKIRLLQVFDGKNSIVFDLFRIRDVDCFIPFLSTKRFIAHNAIFDLQFFLRMGVKEMQLGCTRILAKLLFHATYPIDSGLDASLASLCEQFLKTDILKALQRSDWSADELTFEQIEYASLDAIAVLKLAEKLAVGLPKYGLERVYKLYRDSQAALAKMQMNGLLLDSDAHRRMIDTWRDDGFKAREEVLKLTGLDDVTNSKLATWLSTNLPTDQLKVWPRTPSGKLSTDAHTWADFGHLSVVQPFLRYQKVTTLAGTFGQGLLRQINPATKRIHCGYNICGARTGRLSCHKPNFQNLPREGGFRAMFSAQSGRSLIAADYSQIELRVAAELSRDRNMLKVYQSGEDIYKVTAAKLNRKALDQVTKSERQTAKALALGLLFGLGKTKFAHYAKKGYGVDISEREAEISIEKFRELYSGYREWQLDQADKAKQTLLCYTPCGKRRRLLEDDYYGSSMNQPIQGGAAEILLHSLVDLEKKSRQYGFNLLNTVHDEVVIETDEGEEEETSKVVIDSMTKAYLSVFPNGVTKNLVEAKWGKNWEQAK